MFSQLLDFFPVLPEGKQCLFLFLFLLYSGATPTKSSCLTLSLKSGFDLALAFSCVSCWGQSSIGPSTAAAMVVSLKLSPSPHVSWAHSRARAMFGGLSYLADQYSSRHPSSSIFSSIVQICVLLQLCLWAHRFFSTSWISFFALICITGQVFRQVCAVNMRSSLLNST